MCAHAHACAGDNKFPRTVLRMWNTTKQRQIVKQYPSLLQAIPKTSEFESATSPDQETSAGIAQDH
eukprot:2213563-Amphidinium_carterae.1